MKTVAIHQPQYLPWTPYFDKILRSNAFIILDNVQFQKNGLQNRNQIKTPQGKTWLTLPVKHSFGQEINDVEIIDHVKQKHLRSIQMNYSRSPFFNEVYDIISQTLNRNSTSLSSISIDIIHSILSYLEYEGEIHQASEFRINSSGSDLILELCKKLKAEQYLSGIGGKNYLNKSTFDNAGIRIVFQRFNLPEYRQNFNKIGFLSDLSILDLLFNEGKRAIEIIKLGARSHKDWD